MAWPAVCARRLARHGLAAPVPAGRLAEQVGVICGAHAQVMAAAEVSVGLRVAGITRADVRRALWADRTLVKTYGPRGTVHLLPAADLAVWATALGATSRPPVGLPPEARLTGEQTDAVVAAVDDALAGEPLTVDELGDAVVARTGPWAGDLVMPAFDGMWPRWRQAIATVAWRGALCFGPDRGRKVTYTSPRRWLPAYEPPSPDAATAEVVRRYLHAYGPATPQQFARWLAATPRWAVELFDRLVAAGELEEVTLDGAPAWVVAGDTALPDGASGAVHLLPYFDAYGVGCHPREKVFPGRAAERALAGGQAGPVPVLLVGGVVAGVWHQRRSGRKLAVTVEPFGRLTARQRRELDEQVARVAEVLEAGAELTIGEVTAGKHL